MNKSDCGRFWRGRGQSLVEFALVLPVMLLVLLLAADFGRLFAGYVSLSNATRVGANFAAMQPAANYSVGSTSAARADYDRLVRAELGSTNCPVAGAIPPPTFSPNT